MELGKSSRSQPKHGIEEPERKRKAAYLEARVRSPARRFGSIKIFRTAPLARAAGGRRRKTRPRAPKHDAGSAEEHQRTASALRNRNFGNVDGNFATKRSIRRRPTSGDGGLARDSADGVARSRRGLGLDRSARGQARTPARIAGGAGERGSPSRRAAERCAVRRRHGARE
ncbi:hypothetical protein NL676_027100 [Syzygium grande]|nr:hypothetical protein NL676_027100 [Syzygium grande]